MTSKLQYWQGLVLASVASVAFGWVGCEGSTTSDGAVGGTSGGATGGAAGNAVHAGGGTSTLPAGGSGGQSAGGENAGTGGADDTCAGALSLGCGDRWSHSTTTDGRPNQWIGYACTQRWLGGRETLYAFRSAQNCQVEVRLADLATDLDLILLSACEAASCSSCVSDPDAIQNADECSSTPIDLQQGETIRFNTAAGQTRLAVVDGYDSAEGSYTIEVDCVCG